MGLLTISQFGSKLLSFFLVPLYTSILSPEDYGTYDLLNVTASLCMPILTLNIAEALLRFSLEDKPDFESIFSHGFGIFLKGLVILAGLMLLNAAFDVFPVFNDHWLFFLSYYILACLSQLLSYFARGLEDIFAVSVSGVISAAVTIGLNVLFLVPLHLGLRGYFLATILGAGLSTLYLAIRLKIWKYIRFRKIDKSLSRAMTRYSLPLILSRIGWWVNNTSDRYIVTAFCGLTANGIYSVGYKIPNGFNMFMSIFNEAWLLSSVKEFDKDDKDNFFAKTYEVYNALMVLMCSLVIATTKITAGFLYAKDFYQAWQYVPFLTISFALGAMAGYMEGIFAAAKDPKVSGLSTMAGAIVNIVLNIVLVRRYGPIGAAWATLAAYTVVWSVRVAVVRKKMKFRIPLLRDIASYLLLIVQAAALFIPERLALQIGVLCVIVAVEAVFYRKEFTIVVKKALSLVHPKKA